MAAAAERAGFGLQAGQLWELARDAGLLSRHTPLAEVAAAIAAARKPPPPVAARRARVLAGGGAAACAVLPLDACGAWPVAAYVDTGSQGTAAVPGSCCAADASRSGAAAAYDPLVELSFREFAECLVRIAALRYPQLPSPARSLQVVLQQHVVPLLTSSRQRQPQGSAGAVGACAAGAAAAAALQRSQQLAAAPAVATSASAAAGWEQQMASEEVVGFLRLRSKQLQAAFAAVAIEALPGAGGSGGASAALGLGAAANADSGMWQSAHTTARRVLRAFEREGLLGVHRLQAGQVAAALLEGLLGAKDAAQGPRCVMVVWWARDALVGARCSHSKRGLNATEVLDILSKRNHTGMEVPRLRSGLLASCFTLPPGCAWTAAQRMSRATAMQTTRPALRS